MVRKYTSLLGLEPVAKRTPEPAREVVDLSHHAVRETD